ncbi:MAG: hypothetical protein ACUVQG_02970 [Thermogutta sp.]
MRIRRQDIIVLKFTHFALDTASSHRQLTLAAPCVIRSGAELHRQLALAAQERRTSLRGDC